MYIWLLPTVKCLLRLLPRKQLSTNKRSGIHCHNVCSVPQPKNVKNCKSWNPSLCSSPILPATSFFPKKVKQSRFYSFSTSALDGGEWSASRPGHAFTPGERTPSTHCAGGWVGPRAGLDSEARGKIFCPRRGSNPDSPVVQPVVRHYTDKSYPAPSFFPRSRYSPFCSILFSSILNLWSTIVGILFLI
jgi:hypothetical protein